MVWWNPFNPSLLEKETQLKIFTLGYQGLSSEKYVRTLVNAGVGIVIDVREHAWSQRPEFVKTNLSEALSLAGIQYAHVKAAGNPSVNRKTARSASECLARYRRHLAKNTACLRALLFAIESAAATGRPACMTCYERSYKECHRSVLMEELFKLEPSLVATHLEPFIEPKKPKTTRSSSSRKNQYVLSNMFLAPAFRRFS